jgi:glycosyltransferase involved in cell wall biosynthesis
MPRVSVVMTVYNGQRFLREAVDSILNQTYADFELIVIDDGSTDATPDILDSYDDPRLRVVTQPRMGRVKSLNRGVGMAPGEYIAIMDADDVSMPERLKEQVRWLDAHPGTAVVGTGTVIIDENGRTSRQYPQPMSAVAIRRALLEGRVSPPHPSAMFRKACFEVVGGYREWFKQAMDYDLWLRMVERYDIDCLPELLFHYRQNLEGITHRQYFQQKHSAAFALQCAERRRERLPEPSTPALDQPPTQAEWGEYHTFLGRAFLDLDRIDDARAEFRRAVRNAPLSPYTWFFYLGSLIDKSFIEKVFPLAQGILRILPWLRKDPLGPFRR